MQKSPQDQAANDVTVLREFRNAAASIGIPIAEQTSITSTASEVSLARERDAYRRQQNSIRSSLQNYVPLFTRRLKVERTGDSFEIYLTGFGSSEFTPIHVGDDGDIILASWADDRFGSLLGLEIGDAAPIGRHTLTVSNLSEFGGEELNTALTDVHYRSDSANSNLLRCAFNQMAKSRLEPQVKASQRTIPQALSWQMVEVRPSP